MEAVDLHFPRLKNALLCRVMVYVVVLGGFLAPIFLVLRLEFLPDVVKTLVTLGLIVGLIVYILKNLLLLMSLDMFLGMLHCRNKARKRFTLPRTFSVPAAERSIARFGRKCQLLALSPQPDLLQYQSRYPITVYASGIEKIIAVYHTERLSMGRYYDIFRSGAANAKRLKGARGHRMLDRTQKKAPINQAVVILILADQVEEGLRGQLFDVVRREAGDGFDTALLPCVVDLEKRICTFDSERIPYTGFQYPAKNRGIRLIRRHLFRGRFPYSSSPDMLDSVWNQELSPENSLWDLWRMTRRIFIQEGRGAKKRFGKMKHRDILLEDGLLYLKWEERGLVAAVELHEESRVAAVNAIVSWSYPKSNLIAKDTVKQIKSLISTYFAEQGYTVTYTLPE